MVFHWRLRDAKSPQVSRTLSILADLNNAIVWMVSTRLLISKSSSTFTNPLVTVLSAPITISITVTYMFHSFFRSPARSRYLSLFSHFFNYTLGSVGTAKSTIWQVLSLFYLFIYFFFVVDNHEVWSSGRHYYYYYLLILNGWVVSGQTP